MSDRRRPRPAESAVATSVAAVARQTVGRTAALLLAVAGPAVAAAPDGDVVASYAERAPALLRAYVAVDTVNPPGNETAGARFLADFLAAEGIESTVLESEPGRGNVVARLEGTGDGGAVVLLSHINVVPADPDAWSHPPFEAMTDADGRLFGRGVLDCKGPGIVQALAFAALAAAERPPARDVILLATAGEETGGAPGAKWLLEEHREILDGAEIVLNEGGFIHRRPGQPLLFHLSAAEKGPCWFRVVADGEPGHGSRPADETAVTRLVGALDALLSWDRGIEVVPAVDRYFAAFAETGHPRGEELRDLERSFENEEFRAWFLGEPSWAALVRDTLAPTVLDGSIKTNVVPARAVAEIDSRLLPGHDCGEFLDAARARIGDEHVRIEPLGLSFPASASEVSGELARAVERLAAEEPEPAVVLPNMLTGFTDSHYFREHGMAAYGMVPLVVSPEQRKTLHAPNENVDEVELAPAVARLVRLIRLLDE